MDFYLARDDFLLNALASCVTYIYMYISYLDLLLHAQGGKHAASACKGGIHPHKEGNTRKREQMIRGDKHN